MVKRIQICGWMGQNEVALHYKEFFILGKSDSEFPTLKRSAHQKALLKATEGDG